MPLKIEKNRPLATFTTLGVGGPARSFVQVDEEEQLLEALELAEENEWPVFILGGGSNLLVSDEGFPGLVAKIELKGIRFDEAHKGRVVASAGEDWDSFVLRCVEKDYAGVECLSGIPGTVGGTPIQNVGAYGQDVGQTISSVRILDRRDRGIRQIEKTECRFSYRSSIFNTEAVNRHVVISVTFSLVPGGTACISYADLVKRFGSAGVHPALAEVRKTVLEIRASKGMLIRTGDPDCQSAGSFFKNPLVEESALREIESRARKAGHLSSGQEVPGFSAPDGKIKVSAAWLIEKSGFARGYKRGRAGLSSKHTLAIINRGGASARDILDLMREIQSGVKSTFGVDLKPEPVFVGF